MKQIIGEYARLSSGRMKEKEKQTGKAGKDQKKLFEKCLFPKGSYTVEASMIVPVFLFMMVTAIACSVDLYHETGQTAEQQKTAEIWVVDDFYRLQAVEGVVKQWKEQ